MASRELLSECHFIIEAYQSASSYYNRSLRSRDWVLGDVYSPRYLGLAARELCLAVSRLVEHDSFHSGIMAFREELVANRARVSDVFADLGRFLELEFKVLRETGMKPEAAARLLADVSRSIRIVEGVPDISSIQNLRERLSACAAEICEAEQKLLNPEPKVSSRHRKFAALRPLGIGMGIIGGGTIMVANAISTIALPPLLGSIGAGIATIGTSLAAIRPPGA